MSTPKHQDQVLEHENGSTKLSARDGMAAANASHPHVDDVAAFCHDDPRPAAPQPMIAERLSFARPIQPSSKGFSFVLRGSDIASQLPTLTFKTSTTADGEIHAERAPTTATSKGERGKPLAIEKPRKVKLRLAPKRSSDKDGVKSPTHSSTTTAASATSAPDTASPDCSSDSKAAPSYAGNEENAVPNQICASIQGRPTQGPVLRLVVGAKKLAAFRLNEQGLHRTNGVIPARASPRLAAMRVAATPKTKPVEATKNQAVRERSLETTNASKPPPNRFPKGAERNVEVVKALHAMVTEASNSSAYRDLLRWSDDGSNVICANVARKAMSVVLQPLIDRHFLEPAAFTTIRRRFREHCGATCTKSLMFHPRFHRDVNNPETFRSVTLEHAAPKRAPKSTTKSRGHFPTFTPLVSRRAPHEVSMAEGSEPLSSTKRKSSDPLPAGKKPRKTVASGTVRLAKDLRTTIGKEPGSSQGAIAAPLYVDHDFSLLPSSLHDVEDVALEGIDLEAPLPILSQSAKSSIKTSEGVQGGPRGSLSDPKNTHTFPPQSMHEPNKEASPNHKTPRKESWKPVIDQLMWDPILTGGSSAFTPVALPDSPRELIAVFTPPPKRVLFDTNQQPPQSPMKGMIPCRGKDLSCDDLDVLDDMSVTKVVAV